MSDTNKTAASPITGEHGALPPLPAGHRFILAGETIVAGDNVATAPLGSREIGWREINHAFIGAKLEAPNVGLFIRWKDGVITSLTIFDKPAADYLREQFPVLRGHMPSAHWFECLRKDLDELAVYRKEEVSWKKANDALVATVRKLEDEVKRMTFERDAYRGPGCKWDKAEHTLHAQGFTWSAEANEWVLGKIVRDASEEEEAARKFRCPCCKGRGGYDTGEDSMPCAWCDGTGTTSIARVQQEAQKVLRLNNELAQKHYMKEEVPENITIEGKIETARASMRVAELDLRSALAGGRVATGVQSNLLYMILFPLLEEFGPLAKRVEVLASIMKEKA